MPAFRYHGRGLVSYTAFKAHVLFPMSSGLVEAHQDELAGFATAKGTIRFTPEHPLPVNLVARIVRDTMAQIGARWRPRWVTAPGTKTGNRQREADHDPGDRVDKLVGRRRGGA